MPSDILGSEILEQSESGKRSFRFVEGPVFTQLLMADEINRASPRTQSALLQAMQEKQVAVNGVSRDLPAPFHVLATQNPIEQEGTYPLPEAQLDRFLMQIDVSYPSLEAERKMLVATTGSTKAEVSPVLGKDELQDIQKIVRDIPVGDQVVSAILSLIRRARPDDTNALPEVREFVAWAPGPRAAQALMLAAKAKALLEGRTAPSVDDVIALAAPVLRHRMSLTYKARAAGLNLESLIAKLCQGL
jgi:MoxR-like ATPase